MMRDDDWFAQEQRRPQGPQAQIAVPEQVAPPDYTQQLSDQETQLDKLRIEKEDFETKRAAAQERLNKMIEDLAMQVTLEPR